MTFKAGDIVKLKSGGPIMTIAWIEDTEAYCEWFDEKKVEGRRFLLTSLTAA